MIHFGLAERLNSDESEKRAAWNLAQEWGKCYPSCFDSPGDHWYTRLYVEAHVGDVVTIEDDGAVKSFRLCTVYKLDTADIWVCFGHEVEVKQHPNGMDPEEMEELYGEPADQGS